MFNKITPVVKNILIINLVIFAILNLFDKYSDGIIDYLGMHYILSPDFKPYQIITYMFVQKGLMHLFGNMFGLYIFGSWLETQWGSKRFLFFYMATGVGAALLYSVVSYFQLQPMKIAVNEYIMNPDSEAFNAFVFQYAEPYYNKLSGFIDQFSTNSNNLNLIQESKVYVQQLLDFKVNTPTVGASGAIFGILLAIAMLFPNVELMLLFPPIPMKAKYFVTFYGVYEFWQGMRMNPGDNVAHFAHLSGMVVAFLILMYWKKTRGHFY